MKAKRVMALVLSAVLTVGSLDTAYLPVLAAGEEQTVTAAEDEAVQDDETAAQKESAAEDGAENEAVEGSAEAGATADTEDGKAEEKDLTYASGTTADGFTYETTSDGMTITGYTGTSSVLNIPETIEGLDVAAIGRRAFMGKAEITSVTIPATIGKINAGAFRECTGLKEVTINAVNLADAESASINRDDEEYSWSADDAKSSVFFKAGASGGMTVTFGEGVERIPAYLFATGDTKKEGVSCKLSKIVIADSVTAIGDYAFYSCDGLKSIEGGEKLEEIGNNSFAYCGFTEYPALKNLETIGANAFYSNANMSVAEIGNMVTTIGDLAFSNCGKLKTLSVSGNVSSIGAEAFRACTSLKTVTINEPVAGIGRRAFMGDVALTDVILPSTLSELGAGAFRECTGLKNVIINAVNLADAESASINRNDSEYSWDADDAKSSIFFKAGASGGMTVTFGEGVERIPAYLFATGDTKKEGVSCKLSKIVIADSVTTIGDYAFYSCDGLKSIEGGEKLEEIGNNSFAYCGFTEYPALKNLETIGANAFYSNANMSVAEIGGVVTTIGDSAFEKCGKLKTLTIGGKVSSIGALAFSGCTTLKNVTVNEPVAEIGRRAFMGDVALTDVILPSTLTVLGAGAFRECSGLKDVTINAVNLADAESASIKRDDSEYSWDEDDAKSSVFFKAGASGGMTVTFGDGAKRIPAYLFATGYDKGGEGYCKVSVLNIPATVTEIGDYTVANCHSLKEIHFDGNAPKKFGENAFYRIETTAYYPEKASGWTASVKKDYGGTITWTAEAGRQIPVSGITLDRSTLELGVGRSATIKVNFKPSNATDKTVNWSSSNSDIATVDNGKVKGIAVGEAVITVVSNDGGFSAECKVTVVENSSGGGDGVEITLPGKKKVPVTAYVTFITNGGDEQDSYYTLNKKGNKASLHKLVRKGYTFKGWYCSYKDKKGKDKTKKISALTATTLTKYAVDGELVLKAEFNPNKYTVKYYKTAKLDGKKVKMKGKAKSWKGAYSTDNENVQNVTIADGSTITAKDTSLELIGWTRVKYGTEAEFETGDSVSLEDLIPDKGKTV